MNNRRQLVIAFGAGALGAPFTSFAQQQGNIPKIGMLWIETGNSSRYVAAFRDGLRAHGYVEGKNISIDDRSLVDRYQLLPEAASKLVAQKVDVILCLGSTATEAASKATSTIPIIMAAASDPVKLGVAASLSKPGGNVTGLSSVTAEIAGKRLEMLKEIVPGIRRVAMILYPGSAGEVASLRNTQEAARALNLEVRPVEIRGPGDIGPAVASISRMDVQAIVVVGSSLLIANRKQVVAAVDRVRLPAIYANSEFTHIGGLMSYGTNFADLFRRAATYADKILKGAKPGDLPIEQPMRYELVINSKTAKALGLKIPLSLLISATEMVE